MKKADVKITVYEMENDFFVEVYKNNDIFEFWIYHRNYGTKSFMFGMPKIYIDCEEITVEDLIKGNFEEQKDFYIQEYMQEE